ncbi:MAG: hypothetical protein MJ145_01225 [Clostridia bacterium]|nr:hypothetical protein [Clostridia bacterium]
MKNEEIKTFLEKMDFPKVISGYDTKKIDNLFQQLDEKYDKYFSEELGKKEKLINDQTEEIAELKANLKKILKETLEISEENKRLAEENELLEEALDAVLED